MPRVPRYEEQARTQTIGVNQVRDNTTLETFGGGNTAAQVGKSMGEIGDAANDLMVHHDEERAKEAANELLREKQEALYNPERGAMNRKGKDALGVIDEYGSQFDKKADEIEGTLGNSRQKAMFRSVRQKEKTELDGHLQKHTFQEMEKHEDEVTEQGLELQRNEAGLNFTDPGKVGGAIENQKLYLADYAKKRGKSQEWLDSKIADTTSKTYATVLDRMLTHGDDRNAQAFFDANKGNIKDADLLARMEKALEEGSLRGEGQRQSMAITQKHGGLGAALAEVDKIQDPKLQDETRRRVKERFSERDSAIRYAQERGFESAYAIVEKSRNKDDIPPSLWASLSPTQKKSIDSYLKSDNTVTDRDTYEEIKLGLANPDTRSKYMTMDLNEYRHKISDSDFQEIVKDRAALAKGDKGVKAKLDGFLTDTQTVDAMLGEAGINSKSDSARLFKQKLDAQVMAFQDRTGKKVTNEDLRKIGQGLLVEGVTSKGFLWDSKARAFELEPGQEFEDIAVPDRDAQEIEAYLRKHKRPVTRENVVKAYLKGKAKSG
jgi:hypothetical protein